MQSGREGTEEGIKRGKKDKELKWKGRKRTNEEGMKREAWKDRVKK